MKLFTIPSIEGARRWGELCDKQIELLLIDGSHTFQHVFEDIQMWIPLMKPGGVVILHDYDSDERGGLVHLGTEVAIKALLNGSTLKNPVHKDRFLYANVEQPTNLDFTLEMCLDTFKDIGKSIVRLAEEDFSSWRLSGYESFKNLLAATMNIDNSKDTLSLDDILPDEMCLVFERPMKTVLEKLHESKKDLGHYLFINNLQTCYLIEKGLKRNRDIVLNIAIDRKKFFSVEERLFMFHHAIGESKFPDCASSLTVKNSLELSVIIAREQIRLGFLAKMLEVLLGWKP